MKKLEKKLDKWSWWVHKNMTMQEYEIKLINLK